MCDPLTIAGIALTGGSMIANNIAAGKVEKARNGALQAERTRQSGLDQQSDAVNAQSQDRYTDVQGKQDASAAKLGDYYTSQQAGTPLPSAAVPTSASNLVVQEQAKQSGLAKDYTNKTGEALGQLRAFGDVMGTAGRGQARDAGLIGQIGGFKRGAQGVLPYELEEAQGAGAGMKMFGDVLGGLGKVATMGGLSGASLGGLFGAAPAAAAAPATSGFLTAPAASMYDGSLVNNFLAKPSLGLMF
jgi:hypothetical protein